MILSPNRSHFGGSCARRKTELPDIAVPEIPVDEEERPLPPPKPLARNALVDGPILGTLLWLAWRKVMAVRGGTWVGMGGSSYMGGFGVGWVGGRVVVFWCVCVA